MALAREHVLMGSSVQIEVARAPSSDVFHTFFSFSRRFENQPCSCVLSSPMIALIYRRVWGRHGVVAGSSRGGCGLVQAVAHLRQRLACRSDSVQLAKGSLEQHNCFARESRLLQPLDS